MTTATIPFYVFNRYSGEVQFTAQIACTEDAMPSIKLGLAVKWAIKSRAYLSGTDLSGAYLSRANLSRANLLGADLLGADLSGADLSGANLSRANLSRANLSRANLLGADLLGADLSGADLSGANLLGDTLRTFKADLWMTLTEIGGPLEAQHTLAKLRAGQVDGRTYGLRNGCACLVGTIAEAKGVDVNDLSHGSSRPAEQWFSMIKPGDLPGVETGGGFAAQTAVEWIEEWCVANGYPTESSLVQVEPQP